MAEKSVRLADAANGLYLAMRDAFELDTGAHSRVIERVDFASGKFISPLTFPVRGNSRTLAYTSGGTHEGLVGDILTGATSAATARVIAISLSSGTWAGGDAAGTLTLCDQVGTFQSENLNEGSNSNICTIAGNSSAVSLNAADTFDLTALPADLLQNLLTVGDKSMLCVAVEQDVSGGATTISPIIFDNESTPNVVAVLPPKGHAQPYAYRRGASSGRYLLPVVTWDVCGAYKVGLHLAAITGTSNIVRIYGWII